MTNQEAEKDLSELYLWPVKDLDLDNTKATIQLNQLIIIDEVHGTRGVYRSSILCPSSPSSQKELAIHVEALAKKHRSQCNDRNGKWWIEILKVIGPFMAMLIFTSTAAGVFYVVEKDCEHSEMTRNPNFTYWSAFHFVFIVETTIGYGDIYPCSSNGRILTIIFALLGVPICLLCLARLGTALQNGLTKLWTRVTHWWSSIRRKNSSPTIDIDIEVGVPLSLAILLLILWIVISATYYYFALHRFYQLDTEVTDLQWTFPSAMYFCVITFLTIGLGDIAPVDYDFVLLNTFCIFTGLSLATMCISIVQTKIDKFFQILQKRLRKEAQEMLIQSGPGESVLDHKDLKDNLHGLMRKSGASWLMPLISDRNLNRLMDEFRGYSDRVNRQTQTDFGKTDFPCQHDSAKKVRGHPVLGRRKRSL